MTDFTPALGKAKFTSQYDRVIAVMTREKRWRSLLLGAIDPRGGDTIVDLGSGTGSLALLIKERASKSKVYAVDPDPEARTIAEAKARVAGVDVQFVTAMGNDLINQVTYGSVDKVTVSLVLHQCPDDAKAGLLSNALRLLRPGGTLIMADYGVQPNLLMQILFNQVRSLDGYDNTRANKDGRLPEMMRVAGFATVEQRNVVQTPTGAITLWVATKAVN